MVDEKEEIGIIANEERKGLAFCNEQENIVIKAKLHRFICFIEQKLFDRFEFDFRIENFPPGVA